MMVCAIFGARFLVLTFLLAAHTNHGRCGTLFAGDMLVSGVSAVGAEVILL